MRRRQENGDEMHDGFGSKGRGGGGGSNSGGGYYSAPTDRIRETNHNIMEMQNNAHMDDLSDQVMLCLEITCSPRGVIERYRERRVQVAMGTWLRAGSTCMTGTVLLCCKGGGGVVHSSSPPLFTKLCFLSFCATGMLSRYNVQCSRGRILVSTKLLPAYHLLIPTL